MYCTNCGSQNKDNAKFCFSCGKPLNAPESITMKSPVLTPPKASEPGRGSLILAFGIVSLALLGPILGIPAWVMGHRDLKKIQSGVIAISQQGLTRAGMILGIIGTFISPFVIIAGIAVAVGITMFQDNAVDQDRSAVIADLTTLAAKAQQYYAKPARLGGGENSFVGLTADQFGLAKLASPSFSDNRNGRYTIKRAGTWTLVVLHGVGKTRLSDGTFPEYDMEVTSQTQIPRKVN